MDDHLLELDDAALVERHNGGDPAAFDALVMRHRDRAWSVAMRTLGDPTEAADAVQESFISAYRALGSFRSEAKFSTWLHRIVVNACLDRVRRQRSRPTVPLEDALVAATADQRDHLAERETANEVTAALAKLSDEQRLAIVLVDLNGFSVDEAADLLGVPAGTVKSRCHRGRVQLAVLLGHLRMRDPDAEGTAPTRGASKRRKQEAEEPPTPSSDS